MPNGPHSPLHGSHFLSSKKKIWSVLAAVAITTSLYPGLLLAPFMPDESHHTRTAFLSAPSARGTVNSELFRSPDRQKDSPRGLSDELSLAAYGQLPLAFEANRGQAEERVRFISRGDGYTLLLTQTEMVLTLSRQTAKGGKIVERAKVTAKPAPARSDILRLKFIAANAEPEIAPLEKLPGKVNYLSGNDPAKWRTNIPTYSGVKYGGIYRGVDLVFYGNQRRLEYDLVVAPGADPGVIAMRVEGGEAPALDRQGNMEMKTAAGTVTLSKPEVYQEISGMRLGVECRFVLRGERQVGFEVGSYDTSKPLIIDPVLVYSTYLGMGGIEEPRGIAIDSAGNAYITGHTGSANYYALGAYQPNHGGFSDAFVTKLNATGTAVLYSTFIGGNDQDEGSGIAVDTAGNAYITGRTGSTNFPVTTGTFRGNYDAFVTKLNAAGNALVFSIFLGGSSHDLGRAIALDSFGNAYVTGETISTDFDVVQPAYQSSLSGNSYNAFVTRVGGGIGTLYYSTYLGGPGGNIGYGIAVDSAGSAYVTGLTFSPSLPTTAGAYQTTFGGGQTDAFVTKLNATGSALLYSTLLGGSNSDVGWAITLDSAKNAYVGGQTASTDFDFTAGAYQTSAGGGQDAFVTKLNPTGGALVYSTYLGKGGSEMVTGISLDSANNAYVIGTTNSNNFPLLNPTQSSYGGNNDVFVTELNAAGNSLLFSTYLGGGGMELGLEIAVDNAGGVYVVGYTASPDFPTTSSVLQANYAGGGDGFVTKIGLKAAGPPRCVDPPNTTMVAWYPFDETSGATADNLATGNTATLYNSPVHLPGKVAGALRFDGWDDAVDAPSTIVTNIGPAGLPPTCSGSYSSCRGDFSIDAWVKIPPNANPIMLLVFKMVSTGPTTTGYSFWVINGSLWLQLGDGGAGSGVTNYSSAQIPVATFYNNQWHHIAVTVSRRTANGIRWYFDGVVISTSDPTAAPTRYGSLANSASLTIGSLPPPAWFGWLRYKGDLDELEIFNRELTQAEVKSIFTAGSAGKCKK